MTWQQVEVVGNAGQQHENRARGQSATEDRVRIWPAPRGRLQAEVPLRLTVRSLLEAGAHKQEIKEAIAMTAVFAGVPAMTRAMDVAQQVLDPKPEAGETT